MVTECIHIWAFSRIQNSFTLLRTVGRFRHQTVLMQSQVQLPESHRVCSFFAVIQHLICRLKQFISQLTRLTWLLGSVFFIFCFADFYTKKQQACGSPRAGLTATVVSHQDLKSRGNIKLDAVQTILIFLALYTTTMDLK